MLIVAKITQGAAAGYATYLEAKTETPQLGDYYLKDGERIEAPGRWAGGAEQFGLDAHHPVTGEQLRALMAVRRPDSGEELRRVGGSGEAVSAIDATFSAPKSVSTVWALADAEVRAGIERAHETAIDRALTYATTHVPMLRRRVAQDTVVHEKAAGVIATSWRHTTARAVADQVPDPQLHSHVLLHAAVRSDGETVAIDSRSWLVHQREVGAAYRTELAHELHQLGFAIQRGTGRSGRYFELADVPAGLIDRWSSRHHQVHAAIQARLDAHERDLTAIARAGGPAAVDAARQLQALQESGQLSPKQERLMGTTTRAAKLPVTTHDLDAAWQHTAAEHRFNRERVQVLAHQAQGTPTPADPARVLAGLTEFDATFPARDARAVALEQSAGASIDAALAQLTELRASEEILLLADGSGTTREHRGRERTVVAIIRRLTDTELPPLPTGAADREADRLDAELSTRGGRLSAEQRAAIHLACGGRPLVLIEGHAGTGKSTALAGITRAHQANGREILITSTAALAAERLAGELTDHGVVCRAYSTAALTNAIRHERVTLTPHTTIVHDEAALASTREQLDLLDAVERSGARLIAIGDPQQNQPVGAGGLWEHIETAARDRDAHVKLTHNQRARDPADRRAQALFRDGHAERAIRGYAARDHVHLHHDPQRAEDQALDAAHRDRTSGMSTTIIAQTSNHHLDALNARAQAIRDQAGELGHDSLPVPGRPYALHPGDHVQVRRTIHHPDHGPLRNGTSAQVTTITADNDSLELTLADGTKLPLSHQQIASADLRLAYVQHPFPAQGQTTDTTHLIIAEHATREGTYVGLTRARQGTHIYASELADPAADRDRLTRLADHVNRSEPDMPSIHTPLAPRRQRDRAMRTTERRPRELKRQPRENSDAPAENPSRLAPLTVQRERRGSVRPPDPTIQPPEQKPCEQEPARGPVGENDRHWPRTPSHEPATRTHDADRKRDRSPGYEP